MKLHFRKTQLQDIKMLARISPSRSCPEQSQMRVCMSTLLKGAGWGECPAPSHPHLSGWSSQFSAWSWTPPPRWLSSGWAAAAVPSPCSPSCRTWPRALRTETRVSRARSQLGHCEPPAGTHQGLGKGECRKFSGPELPHTIVAALPGGLGYPRLVWLWGFPPSPPVVTHSVLNWDH